MTHDDYDKTLAACCDHAKSAAELAEKISAQLDKLRFFKKYSEPSNRLAVLLSHEVVSRLATESHRLLDKLNDLCNDPPAQS